ncbi:hypothetical protein RMSM_03077 [Rhodopirellula maiorica SM1]|uniref:Uncharacterized protein n=1 Tax=Rhodopirellula maiorica SM1 TaxID=1265738 RepID=M5RL05_9BACT|nr:hypothetical protein RMSM_03077 [Rhodopirellula maiorica SM1]
MPRSDSVLGRLIKEQNENAQISLVKRGKQSPDRFVNRPNSLHGI